MSNLKFDLFKKSMSGKDVAVIGIGVSNLPLIKLLISCGARVTARDIKTQAEIGAAYHGLKDMGVRFQLGEHYLSNLSSEIIFKTPGIRFDLPELVAARKRGSVVTSEMEVFFDVCPVPIIAVTGSDGKTTTTTLICEMLRSAGFTCHLGGNIGKPLLSEADAILPEDKVVLELSSFQLHTMKTSPGTAVITNITPNHLDMHKSMEEYIDAKRNIYRHQTAGGRLVTNYDNEITRVMGMEAKNSVYFSRKAALDEGIFLKEGVIVGKHGGNVVELLDTKDIAIPGAHNVENYMAAIGAVHGMVSKEDVRKVAKNFRGVEHRMEFVRELDGVKYYNDSASSSPARSTAGVKCFDKKVILIAGGYDKKIPFDDFGGVVCEHVKTLILFGQTADKIQAAVKAASSARPEIVRAYTLKDTVLSAKAAAAPGDVVLFSPACASFDMFNNAYERGRMFKEIVNKL